MVVGGCETLREAWGPGGGRGGYRRQPWGLGALEGSPIVWRFSEFLIEGRGEGEKVRGGGKVRGETNIIEKQSTNDHTPFQNKMLSLSPMEFALQVRSEIQMFLGIHQ